MRLVQGQMGRVLADHPQSTAGSNDRPRSRSGEARVRGDDGHEKDRHRDDRSGLARTARRVERSRAGGWARERSQATPCRRAAQAPLRSVESHVPRSSKRLPWLKMAPSSVPRTTAGRAETAYGTCVSLRSHVVTPVADLTSLAPFDREGMAHAMRRNDIPVCRSSRGMRGIVTETHADKGTFHQVTSASHPLGQCYTRLMSRSRKTASNPLPSGAAAMGPTSTVGASVK